MRGEGLGLRRRRGRFGRAPRLKDATWGALNPRAVPRLPGAAAAEVSAIGPALSGHKFALRVEERHEACQRCDHRECPMVAAALETNMLAVEHPAKVIECCALFDGAKRADGFLAAGVEGKR